MRLRRYNSFLGHIIILEYDNKSYRGIRSSLDRFGFYAVMQIFFEAVQREHDNLV